MNKILYIELLSPIGHKMYNKIQIMDLLKSGYDIDLISKKHYFDYLNINNKKLNRLLEIDEKYYKNIEKSRPIQNRFFIYKILIYIKKQIDFSKYDYVIFSSYEEISFFFSNISKASYLINHNNLSGIDNFFKNFFFNKNHKNHKLIVLQKKIKEVLERKGIRSIYVPHGLPERFSKHKIDTKNTNFNESNLIVFSPSSSSSDITFFENLLSDVDFINFIEENKIFLILRGKYNSNSKFILVLDYYLSQDDYEQFFLMSNVILINYNNSFKNRVSGVYYESISNDKVMLVSKMFFDDLDFKEKNIYVYDNKKQFKESLKLIIKNKNIDSLVIRNKQIYEPNIIFRIEDDYKQENI